ncbi:TonB-dependent receptor plug domain-containing protein [Dysgonomonas sp. HDW5B]|uniref:M56 family metallopeptidase n=1 Tax=Dysgonomonas sp. HDW5B TaxID=2714927 RepID=UPI00140C91B3|nr:M56 family metallopeptidase [Dysgonomonas sp. HDW5B]QIK53444.1 TonB-dependent receptor plug domain-containing protein [Dysgonomonas sp. HDW5B]
MKEFIIYIGQSAICIGIFFIIYRIFLRSSTSFRFNRIFLLSGLLASFILPTIRFSYDVVLPVSVSSLSDSSIPPVVETAEINIWFILSIVYIIGIIIQLLRNLTSYRKIIQLIRSGIQTKTDYYKVVDSPLIKSPFTVLNCIAINTMNMSEIEKDVILKHEITHISQKHWIDLLCSECALLLQWFNPLMWLYVSSQKENHEFLADKAVIDAGISPAIYQAALINQRFQGPVFSFSNSFTYPNQLNRLFMIKKEKTSPWRRAAVLALIPSFGLFFWASATPRFIFKSTGENSDNMPSVFAQDSVKVIGFAADHINNNSDPNKALYIIDGKESSVSGMKELDPKNIESVSVLKDKSAIAAYGSKGENGVIVITTKKGASVSVPIMINISDPVVSDQGQSGSNTISVNEDKNGLSVISSDNDEGFKMTNVKAGNPLVFINGKEELREVLHALNPDKIEKMEVLKADKAIESYGERAQNGVILITLKTN